VVALRADTVEEDSAVLPVVVVALDSAVPDRLPATLAAASAT